MIQLDTKSRFSSNGVYTTTRRQLHEAIARHFLSGAQSQGMIAIILGGGSGAGKTSVATDIIGTKGFVVVDSDAIKEHIPEYSKFMQQHISTASDLVHEESTDIAKNLLHTAIQSRLSLIYDGTFANHNKYKRLISQLKQKQYTIQLIIIDVDISVAKRRVKARFAENQRYVPEEVVQKTNSAVAKNFIALKDSVDEYLILDNSLNGTSPTIIARKDKGCPPIVFNDYAYHFFLKKGRQF
ncbi:AAA family ATPase [Listeria booriae]|uniref:zeta toxin family protein n=1 Tax=Listeria booriae TaxID=1552123 RepID=UPI0016280113|nr:zeta toxin family protein [Listeria booriae]MBC1890110.1 AAA family ATPase [Listeria booriae]